MTQHCSDAGLRLIEEFEGGRSADGLFHAYWDPFGQVETIGFGQTRVNGGPVRPGTTWTLEQAQADLRLKLAADYEPAIRALGVPLNDNQFAALCSFTWNLGPGSMQWDIGRYLRAREYGAAANALLEYNRAGGQVLAGLARRRQAERALFLTPWVDPDPRHYALFDDTVRDLGHGHKGSERAIVQEYDRKRKHPFVHRPRLARLRDDAGILAGRLEKVIHDDPAGNAANDRVFRHGGLVGRADGRRYA